MSTEQPDEWPVEPPPSDVRFPSPDTGDERGVVFVGGDLAPGTLLNAYRSGLFPMRLGIDGPLAWWSPDPRGILPVDGLKVSRSLRKSIVRYEVRIDTAFEAVLDACAKAHPEFEWITEPVQAAYLELHRLGWVHSVECWTADGELVGGLYGVAIGGLFAGESMFHHRTDASKVALVTLVQQLRDAGASLIDAQWLTPHLESLGAVAVPRPTYLQLLNEALTRPLPGFLQPGARGRPVTD